jgi:hypothetical protein
MSMTKEQTEAFILETQAIIDRVAQEAKNNILRALQSGAIEPSSYSASVIANKVVAKAVLVDSLDRTLNMAGLEADVKNLVKFI